MNSEEEQLTFNTLAQGLWLGGLAVALGDLQSSRMCVTQGKLYKPQPSREATQTSYSDSKKQGAQSRTPQEPSRVLELRWVRSMLGQNARRLLRSDSRSSCVVEGGGEGAALARWRSVKLYGGSGRGNPGGMPKCLHGLCRSFSHC